MRRAGGAMCQVGLSQRGPGSDNAHSVTLGPKLMLPIVPFESLYEEIEKLPETGDPIRDVVIWPLKSSGG